MSKLLLSVIGLLSAFSNAFSQEDSTKLWDGPYLFHEEGKLISKGVLDGKVYIREAGMFIAVQFRDHKDWNFEVPIKQELLAEPSVTQQVEKIFAVSDVEGEFEAFRKLLIANKIMDKHYRWIFGQGHLVICGDLFDRGEYVPEFLWLLYKLEQEAVSEGGYVHTLLGNHDIMNLSGDVRYVKPKYFESAKLMGMDYMQYYDEYTELGRWLRTKNIVEKIGDRLFLHAGISPQINALRLPLEELNTLCRTYYGRKKAQIGEEAKVFFDRNAPFWYRGYFMTPRASMATIDSTLSFYNCSQIIVGHTILAKNIAMFYQGKVVGIDLDQHEGKNGGIFFRDEKWSIADDRGKHHPLNYVEGNDEIKDSDIL